MQCNIHQIQRVEHLMNMNVKDIKDNYLTGTKTPVNMTIFQKLISIMLVHRISF